MFSIFLATISGVFVILSMITNANLAKRVGIFQSALVNYIAGLSGIGLLMLAFGDMSLLQADTLSVIPLWAYGGGFVGALIVASSNVVIPKIPAVYATLLFFIGQIIAGLTIDYFQFGTVDKMKFIGGALVLMGMAYNIYIDKMDEKEIEPPIKATVMHEA
ncbi:DMT family transporter [Fusibacter sp. JL216-2]|uniref:DMT family transporter n=1 Tax=Fusibacter sp. JL216-2 TaxID=3071453 RepID=UPI003D332975